MKRSITIVLLLGLVVGIFVLRGSLVHLIICMVATFYVAPLVVLIFAVWGGSSLYRQQSLSKNFKNGVSFVAAVAVSTILSYLGGRAVNSYNMRQIRTYVSRALPELDGYRREHGSYPESLSDLSLESKKPKILSYLRAKNDSQAFSFYYSDPSGLFDGWDFSSSDREWLSTD